MVVLRSPAERERWLAFFCAQPLPQEVESKPYKARRSSEQNRLLFGVMYPPIAAHTGFTVDEIHAWMLGSHFGWVDKPVPRTPRNSEGVESVPYRTTTKGPDGRRSVLTKAEFSEFLEHVEHVAAKAGVYVTREAA